MHRRWCSVSLGLVLACGGAATSSGPSAAVHDAASADVAPSEEPTPARVERVRHDVRADDGHPIAVWEKSMPGAKGIVVLVHGRTWSGVPDFDLQVPGKDRSLMDALVARGFATYAIDLRGYGGTKRDHSGWVTPNRADADIAATLAWIAARHPGLPKPAVLGWSLGSLVVQLAAQRRPESMSAAILYGYPRDPQRPATATDHDPATPPAQANTRANAASDFITPASIDQATIDAYVDAALAADPVRADWRSMSQWAELDPAKVKVP
ncbi:MAG TPA: alpha/beta fold hydrolase, partial [Nannocystaceae bacterium]|nr:alpha/beta fold hydrolase [Nannocystaceae bacterium]